MLDDLPAPGPNRKQGKSRLDCSRLKRVLKTAVDMDSIRKTPWKMYEHSAQPRDTPGIASSIGSRLAWVDGTRRGGSGSTAIGRQPS